MAISPTLGPTWRMINKNGQEETFVVILVVFGEQNYSQNINTMLDTIEDVKQGAALPMDNNSGFNF